MFDKRMMRYMFTTRFHHSAWVFILVGALTSLIFHILDLGLLSKIFLSLTAFTLYFFRNPKRFIADVPNSIVSPADGTIVEISHASPPDEYKMSTEKWTKIGIFLSPLNAHINRLPISGIIEQNIYTPGKFFNAISPQSRDRNERRGLAIQMTSGEKVLCMQIAGFVARRIVCNVQRGDNVKKGNAYGIICFGSRVDLYVPQSAKLLVTMEQGVRAGESIIGLLKDESSSD